jgi:two-component system sensor histidine kinase HydH
MAEERGERTMVLTGGGVAALLLVAVLAGAGVSSALVAAVAGMAGAVLGGLVLLGRQGGEGAGDDAAAIAPVDPRAELALAEERYRERLRGMVETLAHELRNPLAGMKGNLQLMEATYPTGTQSHSDATELVADVVRLERIVQGLLSFVRAADVHPAPCEVDELVQRTVSAVPQGEYTVSIAPDVGLARLDADRVAEALRAVLRNAAQANGEAPIEVTAAREDDTVRVTVRDHGAGIDEAERERLFAPFYTTRTHGLGLGLALARQTVEAHGGRLDAGNHPEGGGTFTLSFPGGQ